MNKVLLAIFLTVLNLATAHGLFTSLGIKHPKTCWADTIYLKGAKKETTLKVNKVTETYVLAEIQKSQIFGINMKPESIETFPDIISFNDEPQKIIKCKITGIKKDFYTIRIPMADIKSLDMSNETSLNHNEHTYAKEYQKSLNHSNSSISSRKDSLDMELLEDMELDNESGNNHIPEPNDLMREPLSSNLETSNSDLKSGYEHEKLDTDALKEEIKKEIIDSMNKKEKEEEDIFLRENTGKVVGTILRKGEPYPKCKVQIVALMQKRVFLTKVTKRGSQLETETDENGKYYFENVPEGEYKLFWKPHYETSWIRRLDMKPDVTVTKGKTTYPKNIDIVSRVLN